MAAIKEKDLTKGELRKLNALRKSIGDKLGEEAFSKWLAEKPKAGGAMEDPIATQIEEALSRYANDKKFKLGLYGYTIKRAKGRGAVSGFVATKNEAPE